MQALNRKSLRKLKFWLLVFCGILSFGAFVAIMTILTFRPPLSKMHTQEYQMIPV